MKQFELQKPISQLFNALKSLFLRVSFYLKPIISEEKKSFCDVIAFLKSQIKEGKKKGVGWGAWESVWYQQNIKVHAIFYCENNNLYNVLTIL